MAEDALVWAREKVASMAVPDLKERAAAGFTVTTRISSCGCHIFRSASGEAVFESKNGEPLTRWEQVFIYNHMAQGGRAHPTGNWKALQELPNTVSKIKSMRAHVEGSGSAEKRRTSRCSWGARTRAGKIPRRMPHGSSGRFPEYRSCCSSGTGRKNLTPRSNSETITEHLDIESILFLSERLTQLLCEKAIPQQRCRRRRCGGHFLGLIYRQGARQKDSTKVSMKRAY